MISKLQDFKYIMKFSEDPNGEIIGNHMEPSPSNVEIVAKINEIIEYINSKYDDGK